MILGNIGRKHITLRKNLDFNMVKKLSVYIPSYKRVGKVITLKNLADDLLKRTFLIVHESEYRDYKKIYGKEVEILKCPVMGIAPTRQWCIENCDTDYLWYIDDDMTFNIRVDDSLKLRKASNEEVYDMAGLLLSWLEEGFIHVGISPRLGNNYVEEEYVEIARMYNTYAYNVKKFLSTGIRWDTMKVMEDFHVTLSLLEKGYKNRVTYKYAWNQIKSGMVGGCSGYRNDEIQKEAALKLKDLHPFSVTVVEKTSKEKWEGFKSRVRTDVDVSWKKAYNPKKKFVW
jgi:hypothetical protein